MIHILSLRYELIQLAIVRPSCQNIVGQKDGFIVDAKLQYSTKYIGPEP